MNSSVHRFRALWCGISLLACILSGCQTAPTVPLLPRAYVAPRVDCTLQQTADTPAWPVLWWLGGPAFAIEVLGILTQERELRAREHACIAGHKAKGIIR